MQMKGLSLSFVQCSEHFRVLKSSPFNLFWQVPLAAGESFLLDKTRIFIWILIIAFGI